MALTAEQIAVNTTRLAEAEDALHKMTIGGQASVYVDQNGERVEFARGSVPKLRGYIMELKISLGLPTGVSGPMRYGAL